MADRNRIEEAISNLIHNSIKPISTKSNMKKRGIISIKIKKSAMTAITTQ
ncbi:hypothetical protein [Candidatus Nitrosocosmicus franklandus]|nr:hypothetical protein [Candidatus Nitrosocosmicus franklandus]